MYKFAQKELSAERVFLDDPALVPPLSPLKVKKQKDEAAWSDPGPLDHAWLSELTSPVTSHPILHFPYSTLVLTEALRDNEKHSELPPTALYVQASCHRWRGGCSEGSLCRRVDLCSDDEFDPRLFAWPRCLTLVCFFALTVSRRSASGVVLIEMPHF